MTKLYQLFSAFALGAGLVSNAWAQIPGYTLKTILTSPVAGYTYGMASDSAGNLYVAAYGAVLKIPATGKAVQFAGTGNSASSGAGGLVGDGGPATSAVLGNARAVAVDPFGNVYIADSAQNRVRKVTPDGTISTFAGPGSTSGTLGDGGPAIFASLNGPQGVAADSSGNVYIADSGNARVRKVGLDGIISTIAGNGRLYNYPAAGDPIGDGGLATSAIVSKPIGLKVDSAGNLFIADYGDNAVRKVTPGGIISTVAGNGNGAFSGDGGLATIAAVYHPWDVAVDSNGNLAIADNGNGMVRLVIGGNIFDIAGTGTNNNINPFGGPLGDTVLLGVLFGPSGLIYVSSDSAVYSLTPTGGTVTVLPAIARSGVQSVGAFGASQYLAPGGWAEIYGSYLGTTSRSWASLDFNGANAPTSLDGTSVKIGGQPAFVSYVSPGQVNVQVPSNIGSGPQALVVSTKSGSSATVAVTVNATQPGLLAPPSFYLPAPGGYGNVQFAVAQFSDGAYVLSPGLIPGVGSRLGTSGDVITIYGIGFGAVSPTVPAGLVAPGANSLVSSLQVFVNGIAAQVLYAGLAPGVVGLYQFNVQIPQMKLVGNPPAPVVLSFKLAGVNSTQSLYLALH